MVVWVINDLDGGVHGVYADEETAHYAYSELSRHPYFLHHEPQRAEVLHYA